MTDIQAGAGGDGGQGGGAAAAAVAGAGGGDGGEGGGGGAASSWRDTLPDTLKADPSLVNFADVGALAQGYIDTKRAATARVEGYRTDDGLRQLGESLRPADAAEYDIPLAEEAGQPMADAFRKFAHETGLPPQWAKGVAEFYNGQVQAAIAAEEQRSQAEVDSLKQAIGAEKFNTNLEAVRQMFKGSGVELAPEDMAALDAKLGSKNLLTFLFDVAAKVGDPGVVEGGGSAGGGALGGAMTPDAAETRWQAAIKDASWREKAKTPGTPEHRESERLQNIIAQGRRAKPS